MAYKSKDLLKEAKELIKENETLWSFQGLSDVMGVSDDTLTKHLKILGELDNIKTALRTNRKRVALGAKRNLIKMVDNPSAQIAVLKMTGTREELLILSGSDKLKDEKKKNNKIEITVVK